MDNSFGKAEKLKQKRHLEPLFATGLSVKKFPVKLIYLPLTDVASHKIGVTAPKRNFKRAVDRNRLKRRLRESYRLHKGLLAELPQSYALMFLYIGRKEVSFQQIDACVEQLLRQFISKINS